MGRRSAASVDSNCSSAHAQPQVEPDNRCHPQDQNERTRGPDPGVGSNGRGRGGWLHLDPPTRAHQRQAEDCRIHAGCPQREVRHVAGHHVCTAYGVAGGRRQRRQSPAGRRRCCARQGSASTPVSASMHAHVCMHASVRPHLGLCWPGQTSAPSAAHAPQAWRRRTPGPPLSQKGVGGVGWVRSMGHGCRCAPNDACQSWLEFLPRLNEAFPWLCGAVVIPTVLWCYSCQADRRWYLSRSEGGHAARRALGPRAAPATPWFARGSLRGGGEGQVASGNEATNRGRRAGRQAGKQANTAGCKHVSPAGASLAVVIPCSLDHPQSTAAAASALLSLHHPSLHPPSCGPAGHCCTGPHQPQLRPTPAQRPRQRCK